RDVEVVLDRVLPAARHENDVVDAGGDGFLDAVLNDRLVDERQHFLRLGFGGRKESRAEARGRKDGFSDDRHIRIVAEETVETRIQWVPCSTRYSCAIMLRRCVSDCGTAAWILTRRSRISRRSRRSGAVSSPSSKV